MRSGAKRLLPALAALCLALAGPAQAAPRERAPEARPAPALVACPQGFAALQDSRTCVRISGRVRAEGLAGSARTRAADAVETRTGGRVQLDVRTQTEYGPLRAVIRAEGRR